MFRAGQLLSAQLYCFDSQAQMDGFPAGVGERLQFYVYRLIDPRNGENFYVGKGKGNRVFQHANAQNADDVPEAMPSEADPDAVPEDDDSLKVKRIREIRQAGLDVIHIIHRHGIVDAKTAYEVEAALIDAIPGLSNIAGGHHSNDRGPMYAREIADKYALPEVVLGEDKLILININSADHDNDDQLLDRTRFAWRISEQRARQADYVLAVIHGIVRGIFVADKWLPATAKNFPGFDQPSSRRLGFIGHKADDDTWERYVGERGKRLPDDMRHGQNPVRYHKC